MKLYDYLENLTGDDFINANGLLLYNKLINKDQVKEICDKYELRLLNRKEFERYVNTKKDNFLDLLKNKVNIDTNKSYKFFVKDDYNFTLFNNQFDLKSELKINDGIGLFKKAKIEKKYKTLDDLKKPSISLLVEKYGSTVKIICYDNDLLIKEYDSKEDFKYPILFFGSIIKFDPNQFHSDENKTPFGSSTVDIATAREDVAGSETLYPIMAYFSDNHLLIPDRGSVSDDAQYVWKKFYSGRGKLKKIDPIDDITNPITRDPMDDGNLYRKHGRAKEKSKQETQQIFNNPRIKETDREIILKELRKDDELNWVYKLNNNETAKVRKIINYLINNHKKNNINYTNLVTKGYDLYSTKII